MGGSQRPAAVQARYAIADGSVLSQTDHFESSLADMLLNTTAPKSAELHVRPPYAAFSPTVHAASGPLRATMNSLMLRLELPKGGHVEVSAPGVEWERWDSRGRHGSGQDAADRGLLRRVIRVYGL